MNTLKFTGTVKSKFERRQLSKLIKLYQFSCSDMRVRLSTIPKVCNIHDYDCYDPDHTLRRDITNVIRMLTRDGYKVQVEVSINL